MLEHSAEFLRGAYKVATRYAPMDVAMQINADLAAAEASESAKSNADEVIAALDEARAERDAYHAALSEIYYRAIPMHEDSGHSAIAHIAGDVLFNKEKG